MSLPDDDRVPSNARRPPATFRGKSKKQSDRFDKFRIKTGDLIQADHKAGILKKYAIDGLLLNQIVKSQANTIPLPISTRGIGFSLIDYYAAARARNIQLRSTIFQAYRVSLAQLHKKVCSQTTPLHPPYVSYSQPMIMDDRFRQTLSLAINFSIVAECINTCGLLERHNLKYCARLLDPPDQILTEASGFYKYPDPFNVSFSNLGDIVETLSDSRVPIALRRFFKENNPIPGARWSPTVILLNGPDIWPPGYDVSMFARDVGEYGATLGLVQNKKPSWMGFVDFSEAGKPGLLATETNHRENEWYLETVEGVEIPILHQPNNYVTTSPVYLEDLDMALGCLTLVGECPDEHIRQLYPDAYAARDFHAHSQSVEIVRAGLVDSSIHSSDR